MFIVNSENNSISNCTIYDNSAGGLYLSDSENNYFTGNSIFGNPVNCVFIARKNILDTSNTVENKPIYYLVGNSDVTIGEDSNAGLVHLVDCSNVTIENIMVEGNYYGIYCYNTTTSTIRNCTSTGNLYGICLTDSVNNTISDCTLSYSNSYGISLADCSNNNFIYNNYFNNTRNVLISGGLSNTWNIAMTPGRNIINGSYLGGNFWAEPDGSGWSQTEYSVNNGFCDAYEITEDGNNVDHLPLTFNEELHETEGVSSSFGTDQQRRDDGVNIRRGSGSVFTENVVSRDSDMQFVGKGADVQYMFGGDTNPVTQIRFTAQTTEGYVMADVGILQEMPEGVSERPSGLVYQGLVISVGDEGLASSGFIIEAVIGFNVPQQWIDENDIDAGTIRLEHYSNGIWERLPTTKVSETDGKLYFEATTKSFSPFAICADTVSETDSEIKEVYLSGENDPRINHESLKEGSDTGSAKSYRTETLLLLLFIVVVVSVLVYIKYRKSDN